MVSLFGRLYGRAKTSGGGGSLSTFGDLYICSTKTSKIKSGHFLKMDIFGILKNVHFAKAGVFIREKVILY